MSIESFVPVPKLIRARLVYDEWWLQFMYLMKYKNCSDVIEHADRPETVKEEDWKQKIKRSEICRWDPEQFFEKFERKVIELHHAGGDTSRRRKLSYLMMCLPDSCRHIIETIDILPEKERTVDYVRQKLIERKQLGAVTESVQTSPAGTNNTL
ncbi:unnamed protein product [Arctia plantaginis]|uniref:Uncharacterized protein n=1 Tax=Arctia plantaginis TaxID=874455 RepID=A0A8S1AYU9_ARCPL|nr:unnamed protein product [Arctia plantaginis]